VRRLFPLALAKMLAKPSNKLLRRNLKRFADSQQSEDGKWAAGFDHLPVTHAEAAGSHVLLTQLAFRSVRPNSMAQGPKESRIVGEKVSGSAHFSTWSTRATIPRANVRFVCYYELVITMDLRHRQLERMERWAATAGPLERFQVGLMDVLLVDGLRSGSFGPLRTHQIHLSRSASGLPRGSALHQSSSMSS
jgi:hypothetical protein